MAVLEFRALQSGELAALSALEAGSSPWPWPQSHLAQSLESGHACIGCYQPGEPQALGYAVMQTILDESSLLNICIFDHWQGRGIGRALLQAMCQLAQEAGAVKVWLEVREGNQAARRLYETHGFRLEGRRRGYYPAAKGREDAILYTLELSQPGQRQD